MKPPWISLGFVALIVVLHVALVLADRHEAAIERYGLTRMDLRGGALWTLATAAVLHADWAHLTLNALHLLVLGWALETLLGRRSFAWLCALSGLCAMAGSGAFLAVGPNIGASGIAFGMSGAYLVLRLATERITRNPPRPLDRRAFRGLVLVLSVLGAIEVGAVATAFFFWQEFFVLLIELARVDFIAHAFGFTGGVLVAAVIVARARKSRLAARFFEVTLGLSAGALLLGAWLAPPGASALYSAAAERMDRGEFAEASRHLVQARDRAPQDPYVSHALAVCYDHMGRPEAARGMLLEGVGADAQSSFDFTWMFLKPTGMAGLVSGGDFYVPATIPPEELARGYAALAFALAERQRAENRFDSTLYQLAWWIDGDPKQHRDAMVLACFIERCPDDWKSFIEARLSAGSIAELADMLADAVESSGSEEQQKAIRLIRRDF